MFIFYRNIKKLLYPRTQRSRREKMNTVTSENHNALAGFIFATLALDFQLGSATRMGPGYFPLVLATVLILSGLY